MYCATFSVVCLHIVNYFVDGLCRLERLRRMAPMLSCLRAESRLFLVKNEFKKTYYRGVNMHQTLFLVSSCLNIKCHRTFKLF